MKNLFNFKNNNKKKKIDIYRKGLKKGINYSHKANRKKNERMDLYKQIIK